MSTPRNCHSRTGLFAWISAAALLTAALVFGCREVLSFEDREYVQETPADGGHGHDGSGGSDAGQPPRQAGLDCATYCDLIQRLCIGENQQFGSTETCMGICATFPPGTLFDESGYTLGCRIHVLRNNQAMIESPDCREAGPTGEGVCGSNCESFCVSMMVVCPGSYPDLGDCLRGCSELLDCHDYTVPAPGAKSPDEPSLQCRFYHLSAAAQDLGGRTGSALTEPQTHHCPHAAGLTKCIPKPDPTCP